MSLTIPLLAEHNAQAALSCMLDRGLKAPHKLTDTCKQIATVTLAKLDNVDKRMVRCLTNRLVDFAHTKEGM